MGGKRPGDVREMLQDLFFLYSYRLGYLSGSKHLAFERLYYLFSDCKFIHEKSIAGTGIKRTGSGGSVRKIISNRGKEFNSSLKRFDIFGVSKN